MTDDKVKLLRAVEKPKAENLMDAENAAEILAALDSLRLRVANGEVIGIVGVVITDDPLDDTADSGVELFEEGMYYNEGDVYMALSESMRHVRDRWRVDFYGPEGSG